MHINTDFRRKIAARNCGFRSIASVGAQIYGSVSSDAHAASGRYGSVSSDAHAASGRKPLFAACLWCDRPVGGRNRKSSGLVKSSVQSESETVGSFTFAVLGKAADGQYRHTLRGGFFQKCLKSSPRRGIYFPAQYFYPYKNVFACANVF